MRKSSWVGLTGMAVFLVATALSRCAEVGKGDAEPANAKQEQIIEEGTRKSAGASSKNADASEARRSWWICSCRLYTQRLGDVHLLNVMLGIAANDQEFIDGLGASSFEAKAGAECDISGCISFKSWGANEKIPFPNRKVKVFGIVEEGGFSTFLTSSFRLKGEEEWIRLSDIIDIEDGLRIRQCSRCLAVVKRGVSKCSNCDAAFGSPAE